MSYNTVGGKEVITPMAFDIAKLQSLYGASSLNSGDTTYSFNSQSTGYNFTGSNRMFTIWDGGGHDTFDLSGAGNTSVTIDLREALDSKGDFHDYKTVVNNEWVYIAHGANIEDAIGGDGNDTIYGNALDNNILGGGGNGILYGGAGNDVLNGGDGDDRMLFSGNFGNDVVTGAETLIVNGATISGNAVSDGGDLYHLANGMQVEKLDDHTLRIDAPGWQQHHRHRLEPRRQSGRQQRHRWRRHGRWWRRVRLAGAERVGLDA